MNQMNVYFTKVRETKNTFRFEEVNNTGTDTPMIGTLYIPKLTLNKLGWEDGSAIQVTLTAVKGGD